MGDLQALEELDGYAALRNGLRRLAADQDHYSGIPMPVDGIDLVVEPTYPRGAELASIFRREEPPGNLDGATLRNSFYSRHRRVDVYIYSEPGGKINWGWVPAHHALDHAIHTLYASDAWGIEQEARALALLGTLISHRQMKGYLLTGTFLEKSPRSGLTYMFRKLRPTVVIDARPGGIEYEVGADAATPREDKSYVQCALCLHPIAYYESSWAGAMCPTDDVIAHLTMMRGDEVMLWRRANQHPPHRPEAGL